MKLHPSSHISPITYKEGSIFLRGEHLVLPLILTDDGECISLSGYSKEQIIETIGQISNPEIILWANNHKTHGEMSHITQICWNKNIGIEFIRLDEVESLHNTLLHDKRRTLLYLFDSKLV